MGRPPGGILAGRRPIYESYKEHVGAFHWTPLELFTTAFPDGEVTADELTVISWILPHTDQTKEGFRKETTMPSEGWARARIFGEEVNNKLRGHVVATLGAAGVDAVAPLLLSQWKMTMSDRYGYASTWSERHAAHASGLGTFSLCDGLITPRGKAMRCGSVVARLRVPPTPRPYSDHRAYCLFSSTGPAGNASTGARQGR